MYIRIRTVLSIFLTTLLIIFFSIFVGVITVRSGIETSQEIDLMMISDIADHFISSEIRALKLTAATEAQWLSMLPETQWQNALLDLQRSHGEFTGMAIWSDRRELAARAGEVPAPLETLDNEYVQQAFGGRQTISNAIRLNEGSVVFCVSAPLPGTNRILVLTLPYTFFIDFLSVISIWETGHIYMDDANGILVSNPRPTWVESMIDPISGAVMDEENRQILIDIRRRVETNPRWVTYSVNDVPRICVYRPVSGSEEGWSFGTVAPLPESPFRHIDRGLIVVGFVSMFLSLIAAIIASGFIKRPFDEIAMLKEEAEQHSRFKSQFLANMSHEMRTPLTAVLGLTELTLGTVQLDDETHSNLVKVYRSGETLLNLINDILDISKIEANKLELHPREYDVPSLINDTISQSILYIAEKPIELILNINENLPNYLCGDELRVRQILNNLLSNAFKFTREGTVEFGLECSRDGDTVWLTASVRDTGVGIKPEDMGKLFALYAKMEGDNRRESKRSLASRRTEGTGLGLSISKRVTEMMDGSITVESEYKKGSTFTVKLKQKYVSDAVIGLDVAESLKKFDYSLKKFDNVKMTRINMSYAKVLIVDDNPTNLDVAKGLMGIYGMRIDCVTSGQQAIDAIRSEKVKYNAVFMDHMMPEMDGIEALRIIRDNIGTEYAKTVPVIALTANAIVGNEEMFLGKGFQAFISKPIDLARLDTVLRQWVRNKEAEALLPEHLIYIGAGSEKKRHLLPEDIPGLDMDKGIVHFGYNEEAYVNVLQSYVKNTRPLLDVLRNVNAGNLDQYAVTVHGIKGSSKGILAENIGNKAEALERAAIAGDYEFIQSANQSFLGIVMNLLTDIEDAINKSGRNKKTQKDKPDMVLLAKLLDACGSYDIDEIDAIMAKIENFEYSSDDGLALWLRESVDQGKYKNIEEKLSVIVKEEV